jgi:hypothetical protein
MDFTIGLKSLFDRKTISIFFAHRISRVLLDGGLSAAS